MTWLVLDVDGVLLDAERDGDGHWTTELQRRFGIERTQLRQAFFEPYRDAIVTGSRPIEPALAEALSAIGTPVTVDDVLACWFSADFVPVPAAVDLAKRAAAAGVGVAAGTNQERRRAEHLSEQLGTLFPLSQMIASADVGHRKPEPEFFRVADALLARGGATPVVFADDSGANVNAARRHGWTAVHTATDGDWIREVDELLGLPSSDG